MMTQNLVANQFTMWDRSDLLLYNKLPFYLHALQLAILARRKKPYSIVGPKVWPKNMGNVKC